MSISVQRVAGSYVVDMTTGLVKSVQYYIKSTTATATIWNAAPKPGESYIRYDPDWPASQKVVYCDVQELIKNQVLLASVRATGSSAGSWANSNAPLAKRIIKRLETGQMLITPLILGLFKAKDEHVSSGVLRPDGHACSLNDWIAHGADSSDIGSPYDDDGQTPNLAWNVNLDSLSYLNQRIATQLYRITYWDKKLPRWFRTSSGYSGNGFAGFSGVVQSWYHSKYEPPPAVNLEAKWLCVMETISQDIGDSSGELWRIDRTFRYVPMVDGKTNRVWLTRTYGKWSWKDGPVSP